MNDTTESTYFFQELSKLIRTGNSVIITAKKIGDDQLSIAITNQIKTDDTDKDLTIINPICISGETREIDEQFFEIIKKPADKIMGLKYNTSAAEESIGEIKEEQTPKPKKEKITPKKESVKKEVNTEKSIKEKTANPLKPKSATYVIMDAQMLIDAGKHEEALIKLQEALTIDLDNKLAKEKIELCNKWIAKKADLYKDEKPHNIVDSAKEEIVKIQDTVTLKETEELPDFGDKPLEEMADDSDMELF